MSSKDKASAGLDRLLVCFEAVLASTITAGIVRLAWQELAFVGCAPAVCCRADYGSSIVLAFFRSPRSYLPVRWSRGVRLMVGQGSVRRQRVVAF